DVGPDIAGGIYPFRDKNGSIKLDRADIEWLLATHEHGRGPVDWNDTTQRGRLGLDIRGIDLRATNLSNLPLARTVGGLALESGEARIYNRLQRRRAVAHCEGANFEGAHLEASNLNRVRLDEADLRNARLELAILYAAHLEGANLNYVYLAGADLRRAFLDEAVYLFRTALSDRAYGGIWVQNTRWNGANMTAAYMGDLRMLGDERKARQQYTSTSKKAPSERIEEYMSATRANRQFALLLRPQGLNEDADRFAYRAQLCQRTVLRRQHKYLRYLGSLVLDLVSGYGYRPRRSVATYVVAIAVFAVFYWLVTNDVSLTHGLFTHLIRGCVRWAHGWVRRARSKRIPAR
ncbi:MAG TPA: pentapeptide repeat-containing protein, partial [Ktedonobacteraceae bacterium]|nr:pentapeptide repeat-containing protein [Ktedonobacteraceae bacterium]